jgi:hypothetical protein
VEKAMPSFDQTPDAPQSFGFKIMWFALKTSDPASVVDAFGLGETTPANWESGLAAVYSRDRSQGDDAWLFVSPPISGWILAASSSLPNPTVETHHDIGRKFDALFSRLMARFDDVQFFGSHRVVDFVAWARALNGKPMRIFAWSGSDGAVLANVGEQTAEEARLGFANLSGLSPLDAVDKMFAIAEEQETETDKLIASGLSPRDARARVRQNGLPFPDEIDVLKLAALWSIDPTVLEDKDYPLGLGLAARLPENLRQ